MTRHATHIASLLFGQSRSPVVGLVPRCRGLIVPIFRDDDEGRVSQLELSRGIEQAIEAGAHVINVSGGERTPTAEAEDLLERALRRCESHNVLVVAAVGNDGCACLQVPAAVPSVLAVGAHGRDGEPLESSNWDTGYVDHGVLAPGEAIEGAAPGATTAAMSGTSIAAPIVSGVAARLLSVQLAIGGHLDPHGVRAAILDTAYSSVSEGSPQRPRYLAGALDVSRAHQHLTTKARQSMTSDDAGSGPAAAASTTPSEGSAHPADEIPPERVRAAAAGTATGAARLDAAASLVATAADSAATAVTPYVYAIGTIGFDFGTEARQDGFRQQMDAVGESAGPPNPSDPRQLSRYLARNPWVSDRVTWTLNLDRTPIYVLESDVPFGLTWGGLADEAGGNGVDVALPPVSYIHKVFRDAIVGQLLAPDDPSYVSRVSVPGLLTKRTKRLASGQVLPVVVAQPRGMYTWNEPALIDAAADQVRIDQEERGLEAGDPDYVKQNLRAFLAKVYDEMRNLGQSAPDRALNYAATNAYLLTEELGQGLLSANFVPGPSDRLYALDRVEVTKSPYCRVDSDCWDVRVTFFDPENDRRAKVVYLFTIDVSEDLPVSLAPTRQYMVAG